MNGLNPLYSKYLLGGVFYAVGSSFNDVTRSLAWLMLNKWKCQWILGWPCGFNSQPVSADQPFHYALSISAGAVLDKKQIKKHGKRIPKKYRKMAKTLDEVRIGHILVPDTVIISPKINHTGMYGVNWSPLKLGLPLVSKPFRLKLTVKPVLTYTFIHSDLVEIGTTHFLRPGVSGG